MWSAACEFACRTKPNHDRPSYGRDLYPAGLRLEPDILHLIITGVGPKEDSRYARHVARIGKVLWPEILKAAGSLDGLGISWRAIRNGCADLSGHAV